MPRFETPASGAPRRGPVPYLVWKGRSRPRVSPCIGLGRSGTGFGGGGLIGFSAMRPVYLSPSMLTAQLTTSPTRKIAPIRNAMVSTRSWRAFAT